MDSSLSSAHRPLSFPAKTFAKVSPSSYLQAHLEKLSEHQRGSLRPNGRRSQEIRPLSINTGSLNYVNGSAVARAGNTAVVCGVRAEVLYLSGVPSYRGAAGESSGVHGSQAKTTRKGADGDFLKRQDMTHLADLNLIVPNVELATGCTPANLPGSPPSIFAQSISQRILELLSLSNMVASNDLDIMSYGVVEPTVHDEEAKKSSVSAFWTLYIDILFISLDGNALDTAWTAVVAALQDTRLPSAWFDTDMEKVLCNDQISEAQSLKLRSYPISTTFALILPKETMNVDAAMRGGSKWLLVDPDGFEEERSHQTVTVVVAGHSHLVKIECEGLGILALNEMKHLVKMAEQRWQEAMEAMRDGGDYET